MSKQIHVSRRGFLWGVSASAALLTTRGAFAELVQTPAQTEGPFYPNHLPLDTDNDLIRINSDLTPAVGEITHLSGRVLDARGNPLKSAVVEIWQVDNNGAYIHTQSSGGERRDAHFQGFGRFLTSREGEYYFRTVKPVPYGDDRMQRTRHIHMSIHVPGQDTFTTQCYVKGEPLNATDGVLNGIEDRAARESVIVDFAPVPGSPIGELAARFDIVLGLTPPDPAH